LVSGLIDLIESGSTRMGIRAPIEPVSREGEEWLVHHEAGHAAVRQKQPHDRISRITIVRQGRRLRPWRAFRQRAG